MKIHWTQQREENRTKFTAHVGLVFGQYWVGPDGNMAYMAFTRHGGARRVILSVGDNRGKHRVDPRARLEFLLTCLDNHLSFDLLPNENPAHPDVVVNLHNAPKIGKALDIDGLYVGRLYRHHAGGIYRIVMITNRFSNKPNFVKTVCYRDILTGNEWSRPFDEFEPSKYQLVPYGTKLTAPSSFRISESKEEKEQNV